MSSAASPMSLIDVYVAPKSLFEKFSDIKKYSWIGLVLMIVITAGSMYSFYGGMSPEWLVEQQMLTIAEGEMTPAELETTKNMMAQTAGSMGTITAVSVVVMMLLITAIYAGYFALIGKLGGDNKQEMAYSDWFSFSILAQMPSLIGTLGFIALFATSATADLPMSLPNYASINQLLLGFQPGDALYTWAESINLFSIWTIVVAAIGLKHVADMPTAKAYLLSAAPWLVIFGIWFAIA